MISCFKWLPFITLVGLTHFACKPTSDNGSALDSGMCSPDAAANKFVPATPTLGELSRAGNEYKRTELEERESNERIRQERIARDQDPNTGEPLAGSNSGESEGTPFAPNNSEPQSVVIALTGSETSLGLTSNCIDSVDGNTILSNQRAEERDFNRATARETNNKGDGNDIMASWGPGREPSPIATSIANDGGKVSISPGRARTSTNQAALTSP